MVIVSHSVQETLNLGKRIAKILKKGDILCLFGELGSGKTVLAKGVAWGLGIAPKKIISPSFVLIREHKNKVPLYHFDLYRLKETRDIQGLGYEEYFYGSGITLIEWADRLKNLMPAEYLKVGLKIKGRNKRRIELIPCGRPYLNRFKLLRHSR